MGTAWRACGAGGTGWVPSGSSTLGAVAALPLALPPLVGVLAFLFLYGESGMLPRALQAAFGLEAVPFAFGGIGAVLAVHVYVFYVYFYLFVGASLRCRDGFHDEEELDCLNPIIGQSVSKSNLYKVRNLITDSSYQQKGTAPKGGSFLFLGLAEP
mgnify:CR=1 FL=1